MTQIKRRILFFFVFVLVACAFLLPLWVSGHKPQEKDAPRRTVSGKVEDLKVLVADVKRISELSFQAVIHVPSGMETPDGPEPFTEEQQELYVLLTRYFGLQHIMVRIAACESRLFHVRGGQVVVGEKTPDVGLFQINPVNHPFMRSHGLNPAVLEHNIAFAKYLFDRRGVRDWSSSQHCWGSRDGLTFVYPPARARGRAS